MIKMCRYVCQTSDRSCMGTTSCNDPTNLFVHCKKRHCTKFPIHMAKLAECIAALENPRERTRHLSVISKSALAADFNV